MAQVRGSAHVAATAVIIMVTMSMLFQSGEAYKLTWDFSVKSKVVNLKKSETIVFAGNSAQHDVVSVDQNGYTNCIVPTNKKQISMNTGYAPPKSKTSYYICSINGHCKAGMRVTVNAA